MLCGSPAYFSENGKPLRPADLERHVCLGAAHAGRILPWDLLDESGKIVRVNVKPRHVISSGESLLAAVLAGDGLAYLPSWLINDALYAGKAEAVLDSPGVNERDINLVWPYTRDLVPKIRTMVDELVAQCQPSAPWERP